MRQHGNGVAEGVVGQVGQHVTRLTERRQVRAQTSYDVTTAARGPGSRRQAAQPAYQQIDVGVEVGHAGEGSQRVDGEWVLSERPG